MSPENIACGECRVKMLDSRLEYPAREQFPAEVEAHLEICSSCREYQAGLKQAGAISLEGSYYTPGLKYRTLSRIEQRLGEVPFPVKGWFGLAVLAGVTLTYYLPLWILTRLLGQWIPSTPLTIGIAFLLFTLLGMLTSAVAGVLLFEKKKGRLLLKTFHLQEDRHV
jgi:predicted anti-sigma-YlaC factor YlaD